MAVDSGGSMHFGSLVLVLAGCASGDGKDVVKDGGSETPTETTQHTPGGGDPNRVVLHRLNRTQYDNTVRDLLGTSQTPAEDFPPDDLLGGFDNIASNLSISPLHLELYELAARSLADEVLNIPLGEPYHQRAEGEGTEVTPTTGGDAGNAWNLWSNGDLTAIVNVPEAGTYTLSTRVWANQTGPDLAQVAIGHDGFVDLTADVAAESADQGEVHSVDVQLDAGVHSIAVSFLNDFYDPTYGLDRNLYVDWIDTFGPTDLEPGPNPLRDRWVTCDPEAIGERLCIERILGDLLPLAYRRPATQADVASVMTVADAVLADGGTFDDALYWSFVTALMSPHFLFRVELDPEPDTGNPHPLDDYEIANRLSYFLWSSMPDDALFAAAAAGDLQTTDGIVREVRRMLLDPRAESLVDDFGGQWLYMRGIESATKDSVTYPAFDAALTASMHEEMRRFFRQFVFEGRDLRELLTATDGEVDEVLADLYGMTHDGTGWVAVDFTDADRGGILGQAGLLTVTAYPARTSPVIRGKFVLGQLLCSEPPPPPAGVEGLDEQETAATVREQLELHRADPVCASCHETMDELGFALEHYDAIGGWRDEDRGFPVDDSAKLPDGTEFAGRGELAELIASDPLYVSCVSEKLLTYALGRIPEVEDQVWVEQIAQEVRDGGYTFESLAVAVATNNSFRLRRGEP
ncbi:MAG: DUF1592 domain-containing protein [Myxococcales bacterium]|nr:DUF1592 domain-containing protein [Myxococcales bacterium]